MIWGIFPMSVNISWEGHALGFFSGIIVAILYKYSGPQPKKLMYEIEEELGLEPDNEYWKEDTLVIPEAPEKQETKPENQTIITYEYKEKGK